MMVTLHLASGFWLLAALPAHVVCKDIWAVHIDESPAPPPDQGAPLSKDAIRDPAMLKWQILGIAGGYVLTLLIILTLLYTVGRRLRRAAQSSSGTLSLEMVKPNRWAKTQDTKSPWEKFRAPKQVAGRRDSGKEVLHGPVAFDEDIVKQHRAGQDSEMERLYAAVMSNETKSPKQVQIEAQELQNTGNKQSYRTHHRTTSSSSSSTSRSFSQRIAEYQSTSPPLPPPPQSYNAYQNTPPLPPLPTEHRYPTPSAPPLPPPPTDDRGHTRRPSASSQTSHVSHNSHVSSRSNAASPNKLRRSSQKDMRISAPRLVAHPTLADFENQEDSETAPLSPQIVVKRSPPPLPLTFTQSTHTPLSRPSHSNIRGDFLRPPPVTPIQDDFDEVLAQPRPPLPHKRQESEDDGDTTDIEEDDLRDDIINSYRTKPSLDRGPRAIPSANPQRRPSLPANPRTKAAGFHAQPQQIVHPPELQHLASARGPILNQDFPVGQALTTSVASPPPPPSRQPTITPSAQLRSASASTNTSTPKPLPFRAYAPSHTLATSQTALNPLGMAPVTSPGPTKTTLLSLRKDQFARGKAGGAFAGNGRAGPAGATAYSGRGPTNNGATRDGTDHNVALISAGLASPYSPYMPFSPMTPVTPRLVGRDERRRKKEEMGRRVIYQEEKVVEDWGEAYED